jgi:lipoprotein-releasing system permease protein
MPLSLTLAWRLFRRARSQKALRLFSVMAVFGLACSVVLIILISTILGGFSERLRHILMGFDAPVQVQLQESFSTEQKKAWEENPAFENVLPSLLWEYSGLIVYDDFAPYGVRVRGVDETYFSSLGDEFQIHWTEGVTPEDFFHGHHVLISEELYQQLPDFPYELNLLHPYADIGVTGQFEPKTKRWMIAGFFKTGHYDLDTLYLFLPRQVLGEWANSELMEKSLLLRPKSSSHDLNELKTQVSETLSVSASQVTTWKEKNPAMVKALRLESIVFLSVFTLVAIVSLVSLMSLVRMLGLVQGKNLMILRSLGLSEKNVNQICLGWGMIFGVLGTVLGVVISLLVKWYMESSSFHMPASYGFDKVPMLWSSSVFVMVMIIFPVVSSLVALWPARMINRETRLQGWRS